MPTVPTEHKPVRRRTATHHARIQRMKRSRIHIMGASGSGTTTLARALANHWSVPHADSDDYFWLPSDPPFTNKRPESERLDLMRALFVPREAWVLSGSMLGWGQSIIAHCDAVIYLSLNADERMRRVEKREVTRRADNSFDQAAWEEFLDWARGYDDPTFMGRSRVRHEGWLKNLDKPVLRLDSAHPVPELVDAVLRWQP